MRTTFHINQQRIDDALKGKITKTLAGMKASGALVMDGLDFAHHLQTVLGQGAIIIHRNFGDSEAHKNRHPRDLVDAQISNGYGSVYDYGINEPVPGGMTWKDIITFEVDRLRYASKHKQRCVALNIGPGILDRQTLETGVFDPLLAVLRDHPEHLLGTHEYTGILQIMGTGIAGRGPDKLLERENFQFPWPDKSTVDEAPRWHVRRSDLIVEYAQAKFNFTPRIAITEWGWDRMPDWTIHPDFPDPYQLLTGKFGISRGHQDMRGVDTLEHVYQFYYPDMHFEDVVSNQIIWNEHIQPEWVELIAWYMINPGKDDWDIQYGTDHSRYDRAYQTLVDFAQQGDNYDTSAIIAEQPIDIGGGDDEPKGDDVPQGIRVVLVQNTANIRVQPRIQSPKIGELKTGDVFTVFLDTERADNDNQYKWALAIGDNLSGWVATESIDAPPYKLNYTVLEIPHPTPAPEPRAATSQFTPEQLEQMAGIYNSMASEIKLAQTHLRNWQTMLETLRDIMQVAAERA
ncbi:MAG: hypothetical protein CUN54_07870 [Phototrophicales bacterium]|nr:MAG: hypothetical protein CUN54_07870 [Phototrophicales bacterium]